MRETAKAMFPGMLVFFLDQFQVTATARMCIALGMGPYNLEDHYLLHSAREKLSSKCCRATSCCLLAGISKKLWSILSYDVVFETDLSLDHTFFKFCQEYSLGFALVVSSSLLVSIPHTHMDASKEEGLAR